MQKNKKGTVRFHSRATSLSLEGVAPVSASGTLLERVRILSAQIPPVPLARAVVILEGVVHPPACLLRGSCVSFKKRVWGLLATQV